MTNWKTAADWKRQYSDVYKQRKAENGHLYKPLLTKERCEGLREDAKAAKRAGNRQEYEMIMRQIRLQEYVSRLQPGDPRINAKGFLDTVVRKDGAQAKPVEGSLISYPVGLFAD